MSSWRGLVQSEEQWLLVEACPVCASTDKTCLERLHIEEYQHGNAIVQAPEQGIRLVRCRDCGLLYKDVLPSPTFLAEVFAQQAGNMWAGNYDFADETGVIRGLMGSEAFDLLDVGASNGGLLRALSGAKGRRSALDIMMHPGLDPWIRGEFIHGLADSENLSWSEEPYDVVTVFDVAEHLYDPNQAFNNLQHLVKPGGFVVVETGDSNSAWPQKYGANHWWYACRFEHHVLWSRESLQNVAVEHGFHVLEFQRKRHKERSAMPLWRDLLDIAGIVLYRLVPTAYGKLVKLVVGKTRLQPWSPFTQDHFRAILQRCA